MTLLDFASLLLGSSYRIAPECQDAVSVQRRQYGRGVLHHVPALQVTVPVIDRGPYGAGLSWDLTTAAADELGFLAAGRVTLGAVSLRKR